MPEFNPIGKDRSEIIDELNMKLITYFLPGLVRMRQWKILYSINIDGVSMQTFYNYTRHRDNTVILVRDHKDKIFGCYCCEEWRIHKYFYGSGESFVFKFEDEDIKVFEYTGLNDRI